MSVQKILSIVLSLIIFSFPTISFSEYDTKDHSVQVVSFNVLAPCWANPEFYPTEVGPYLNRQQRRAHIIHFLNTIADKTDIIALQEVTQIEFEYFAKAFQHDFYAFSAYHDPAYWSGWISHDIPWEPNGVAIFIKKSSFTDVTFRDVALTNDGNHSAYFEGIQQSTGILFRAASIHFDNDSAYNRNHELNALLKLMPFDTYKKDIIAGDFNYGTQSGGIKRSLDKNNFIDTLHQLNKEEWTHPFNENNDKNSGIIDHIVSRNLTPIRGHVINFNLWKLYPDNETKRIIENLQISGSDHFPIMTTME